MKIKFSHLLKSAAIISMIGGLVTGCLSEPDFSPVVEGDGIPINLDGSISQIATKVNAQGFENGDGLGLFAVNYENSNQTPGTLKDDGNQADNVKYIFDQANWKWNPVKSVYYKDVYTNVDLYAYYPYAETSSVSAYTFEVQKDQSAPKSDSKLSGYEASDFLWAKATNIAPTEATIKMTLNHKMAGVNVMLAEGDGFAEAGDWNLLDKKILVTNTTRKATIDLSTGIVTPLGGPQATGIVMCPQTDGAFRAVVVPQEIEAGTPLFSITVGGQSYNFSRSEKFTYTAGKLSNFTITINRKYPSGEYEFVLSDTQISDWKEDINTHEGDARQYYCVHCNEPTTLGRIIKADKKNSNKIRNLKVSGYISDEDFFFMRDSMAILEAVNLKEAKIVDVRQTGRSIYGHNDAQGNTTCFYTRKAGTVDNVIPDNAFNGKKSLCYAVLPEDITEIGQYAFSSTNLAGALIIPDNVKYIWQCAFDETIITSLQLPQSLEILDNYSFVNCKSLSGSLQLPNLKYIGDSAFKKCAFKGKLELPNSLEYIGSSAFASAGTFSGGLRIPDKVQIIYTETFYSYNDGRYAFDGPLDLNNVTTLYQKCFQYARFQGELVIPEGVIEIPSEAFDKNHFSYIKFPTTLKKIGSSAFYGSARLTGKLDFHEGLLSIENHAFSGSNKLQEIDLPSTIVSVRTYAFCDCFNITKFTCRASEVPYIESGSFLNVPKDNFTLEVPANSVKKYQADIYWGEFKRISAHYDFSISRNLVRALNAGASKTYMLRVPSGQKWSVESKPDWVTVTPSSGVGKTEVVITLSEMTTSEATSISVETTDPAIPYKKVTKNLNGRTGDIVFLLEDKDYRTSMVAEQFDYQYGDGDVKSLSKAAKGNGVNIVLMGDCYDAADIAAGNYLRDLEEAYAHFFAVEPYATYKDYFNVYAVFGESSDSGMGTLNTIRDAKFGSQYTSSGIRPDFDVCHEYARLADQTLDLSQSVIVLIQNSADFGGVTYLWGDGSALVCCPKSDDAYPYDFRGVIQHEAGGHAFGKLADEEVFHPTFINACHCNCCSHGIPYKDKGWSKNIDLTSDPNKVAWSHLIFNPKYSDVVDIYEGALGHARGVYRSEAISCMANNIPYFSAISRQAIVERIMEYAGEEFTLEKFYASDSDSYGPTTKGAVSTPLVSLSTYNNNHYTPVYMGEKASVSNNNK